MRKRMMRIRKRLFSWLLCGAVLISLCPQPALAMGVQGSGVATEESGLCEHTRIIPLGAVIPRVRPAAMSVRYAIRKITENQEL